MDGTSFIARHSLFETFGTLIICSLASTILVNIYILAVYPTKQ
jgi:hypothetical protein